MKKWSFYWQHIFVQVYFLKVLISLDFQLSSKKQKITFKVSRVLSKYHILLQEEKKDAFFLIVAALTWTIRLRIPSSITSTPIVVASTMITAILFIIFTRDNWKITINQHTWLTRTQSYTASKGPIILLRYAWGACAGCIQAVYLVKTKIIQEKFGLRDLCAHPIFSGFNWPWAMLMLRKGKLLTKVLQYDIKSTFLDYFHKTTVTQPISTWNFPLSISWIH